jgi:polysaccharide transporter, PST family
MSNLKGMHRLSRSQLVHNISALYGVHVARYLLPLIVVPYLARVLSPSGWGKVAFAQGFAAYLTLIVEYGFNLSATREVARWHSSRERVSEILAGVMGAKCLLAILCMGVVVLLLKWIPLFRDNSALLWAATLAAIAQAFSPLWLFQGLERMKLFATLDIASKSVATVGVFLFVRSVRDDWRVLALQGVGGLVTLVVGLIIAYRWFPLLVPRLKNVLESLRMGWTMFIFRSSVSFYTVGNSFVLGLFAAPQFVGYYAGAERLSRAFVAIFDPISQALFPRLSHLVHQALDEAQRLARYALLLMGTGGLLLSVCVFAEAPILIRILLGPAYLASIPVLRILALLPFLVALSNVLGILWMLPLRMDRAFNTIILSAGAINIALATLLAPRYTQLGMALAVVVAEVFVTGMMFLWLRKKGITPFSLVAKDRAESASVTWAAGS